MSAPHNGSEPLSDRLLTTTEVAELLGLPPKTIMTWRSKGQGPPGVRLGRHCRWRRSDVDAWLERRYAAEADARAAR